MTGKPYLYSCIVYCTCICLVHIVCYINTDQSNFLQEQECFNEELRKAQRRLLKLSRDRRFDLLNITSTSS